MKNNQIILVAILVVLVGGGAFATGYKVGQIKNRVTIGQRMENGIGRQQGGGKMMGARNQAGEVTAVDDKSITLKMIDGSSKIIILTNKTAVTKSTETTKTEIKVGSKIATFGTTNSDGSVTADTIELDPKFLGQAN
jgi:hypothetical protein